MLSIVKEGTYIFASGPTFESPAELRFFEKVRFRGYIYICKSNLNFEIFVGLAAAEVTTVLQFTQCNIVHISACVECVYFLTLLFLDT